MEDIIKDMLAIGLAPSNDFLIKMISIVLKKPMSSILKERLMLKDFHKLC